MHVCEPNYINFSLTEAAKLLLEAMASYTSTDSGHCSETQQAHDALTRELPGTEGVAGK